jgi:hypothetical protein
MKKLIFGAILLALVIVVPVSTIAQVEISVSIALPPLIAFAAPPDVIVLPDTDDVYVVPDLGIDLFFWGGWWWRLWEGHWYRSHYYDRGWGYYSYVPRFYHDVDPSWRSYYRDHDWRGYRWDYERIPDQRLRKNWNTWRSDGYWQRQRTWGVEGYRPLPPRQRQDLRNWRQEQHRQRPEAQQYQQPRQQPQERVRRPQRPQPQQYQQQRSQPQQYQQQRPPQVQQPRQQPQERVRQPQRPQPQPQHAQPQGRPKGTEGEHQR